MCGSVRRTWGDFNDNMNRVANALLASGASRGDRVVVMMGNSVEILEVMFGIVKAGCCVVPLSGLLTGQQLASLINDCGARIVITAASEGEDVVALVVTITSVVALIAVAVVVIAAGGAVVVGATFRGHPGEPAAIQAEMDRISASREASQPLRSKTGGSTFKNPDGQKAWQLVDEAGCRGFAVGGAQVSEKHTNFLINTGEATSADIEALGEEVRRRVKDKSGVELQWEIQRVGVKK